VALTITLKNLLVGFYDPQNLAEFAANIKTLNHVLVVGHSNTTPQILSLMGGQESTLKKVIMLWSTSFKGSSIDILRKVF
jgi:hypothetical protein